MPWFLSKALLKIKKKLLLLIWFWWILLHCWKLLHRTYNNTLSEPLSDLYLTIKFSQLKTPNTSDCHFPQAYFDFSSSFFLILFTSFMFFLLLLLSFPLNLWYINLIDYYLGIYVFFMSLVMLDIVLRMKGKIEFSLCLHDNRWMKYIKCNKKVQTHLFKYSQCKFFPSS